MVLLMWPIIAIITKVQMGTSQARSECREGEVYLSDVQHWNTQDLMFQSKLSEASYDTKLTKKVIVYGTGSEHIANYLQKLNFFGQYIECDNLMLPVYCYIRDRQSFCSDQKQLEIYHEIYPINIKEEIIARKRQFQKFTQYEVWYLLYSIVNACRKFQPYKIKSGNLTTNHVVLNQRGHVKIKNELTEPQEKTGTLANFFSPEQMEAMRDKRNSKLHPNICQTFTVAILIVQICTFIEGESFYDQTRMRLNEVNLGRALEIVERQRYSKLLINLLKIMLAGQSDRPLPSQIYTTFKPYEREITNLQPFQFDTSKIYESLQASRISVDSHF